LRRAGPAVVPKGPEGLAVQLGGGQGRMRVRAWLQGARRAGSSVCGW
jgi:hypothetical protein